MKVIDSTSDQVDQFILKWKKALKHKDQNYRPTKKQFEECLNILDDLQKFGKQDKTTVQYLVDEIEKSKLEQNKLSVYVKNSISKNEILFKFGKLVFLK